MAWRYRIARKIVTKWIHILPILWRRLKENPLNESALVEMKRVCDVICLSGEIQRLHPDVDVTSGYMVEAGYSISALTFISCATGNWEQVAISIKHLLVTGGWSLYLFLEKEVLGETSGSNSLPVTSLYLLRYLLTSDMIISV